MKRIFITLLLAVAAVATVVLWRAWPHLFPSSDTTDLYRRYEKNESIRATELHNFQVNDTLAADALLLEAATDSAWCELLADFGMPKSLIDRYTFDKKSLVSDGRNSITKFYMDKDNIKKRKSRKKPESRLVIASHTKRFICVFLTDEQKTKETISLTEIKKLKNENEF
jgi:hypothetical protein